MKIIKGNLLDAKTEAYVNTVNTVGVMGKGIALQFKEAFPVNFKVYQDACKNKELHTGKLLVVKEPTLNGDKIIINFPTKTEWFKKSQYSFIEEGLNDLVRVIKEYNIKSIAIPPLGCGNGGLKWEKVRKMIEDHLSQFTEVDIQLYEPNDEVKELLKQQETKKEIKLTKARAMILYALFYYESLGENSSLFVANKLAYFLQRLGEKNFKRLKFEASHYGPYSTGVEHLLHYLNGKYIKGLEQMNAKAFEPLDLQYDKANEVSDYIKKELKPEELAIIFSLIKLIDGFQSALSLEILATVDFVRKDKLNINQEDIVKAIHNWSPRKKKLFQEKYIYIALNHLREYENKLNFS